jgi:ATP-dependent helicase/nuclease subunit B
VAAWFLEVEKRRRAQVERILTETRGGLQMPCPGGPFRIRARADRIEVGRDGALAILDYKTGSLPANSDVQRGLSPQLLIEALIAQGGGFAGIPADSEVDSILYLHLKGGEAEPGKEHDPVGTADLRALLAAARRGIQVLLAHFDDPATAYMPVPRPEIAPVFSDYEHLSRLGEWWGAEADA